MKYLTVCYIIYIRLAIDLPEMWACCLSHGCSCLSSQACRFPKSCFCRMTWLSTKSNGVFSVLYGETRRVCFLTRKAFGITSLTIWKNFLSQSPGCGFCNERPFWWLVSTKAVLSHSGARSLSVIVMQINGKLAVNNASDDGGLEQTDTLHFQSNHIHSINNS